MQIFSVVGLAMAASDRQEQHILPVHYQLQITVLVLVRPAALQRRAMFHGVLCVAVGVDVLVLDGHMSVLLVLLRQFPQQLVIRISGVLVCRSGGVPLVLCFFHTSGGGPHVFDKADAADGPQVGDVLLALDCRVVAVDVVDLAELRLCVRAAGQAVKFGLQHGSVLLFFHDFIEVYKNQGKPFEHCSQYLLCIVLTVAAICNDIGNVYRTGKIAIHNFGGVGVAYL
nr:MAG TPA: hypothetical protein [Caudoviricetes sp.]